MNRKEFMVQLEKLLQDIPQEERVEALAYYNGYFEDAGIENEENIIKELESPGKVAKIIKADIGTASEEAKEYTENGYQDRRFSGHHEVMESEEPAKSTDSGESADYRRYQQTRNNTMGGGMEKQNKNLQAILLLIAAIITSPIWLGAIFGAFGIILGILGTILVILVAAAAIVLALYVAGAVFVGVGVSILVAGGLAVGLGLSGTGLLTLALALLGTATCGWIYGKFVPWLVRGIISLCNRPFRGRRKMA